MPEKGSFHNYPLRIVLEFDGELKYSIPVATEPHCIHGISLFSQAEWETYITQTEPEQYLTGQLAMENHIIPFLQAAQTLFPPFGVLLKDYFRRTLPDRTSTAVLIAYPVDQEEEAFLGIVEGNFTIFQNKRLLTVLKQYAEDTSFDTKQRYIPTNKDEGIILNGGELCTLYDNGRSCASPIARQIRLSRTEGMQVVSQMFTNMIIEAGYDESVQLHSLLEDSKKQET
jgi:hypothetical protein